MTENLSHATRGARVAILPVVCAVAIGLLGALSAPARAGVSAVAAGGSHSLFVKTDGTLWAMGSNGLGELGDGTRAQHLSPVQVATGVTAAAAGGGVSLFVKVDGTLWAMGSNTYGELGDGTTTPRTSPVQVASAVRAVAAGGDFSLFVKIDGTLWTMGNNGYGQLGDGTTIRRTFPVQVASGVSSADAGSGHVLFLKTNGTLWSMGANPSGQLGDGTTTNRASPMQVAAGVTAAAAGGGHSLFVKIDGTLWAMGGNLYGNLGDGTTTRRTSPVQITGGVGLASACSGQSFFVKTDGTLWAMGNNIYGQLGDGTTTQRASPVRVASGVGVVSAGDLHSLFVKIDGTIWAMGWNEYGQLGDGTTINHGTPVGQALSIITHPSSQVVIVGSRASFTVVASAIATGTAPLTYQWMKDGTAISGATSATYSMTTVAPSAAGSYSVVVSNSEGRLTSTAATLMVTVNDPPGITTQPTAQAVPAGGSVSFSVVASGASTLTYQWIKDGRAISGATAATFNLSSAVTSDAGSYLVGVTNPAGRTTSSSVTLTIIVPPRITTQPSAQSVTAGDGVSFTVVASDSAPTTYQWKKNGTAISGATTAIFSLSSAATSDAGTYSVVVTNSAGSLTSAATTLSVAAFDPGRLVNLSILTALSAVGDSFTMGYVVGGTGTAGAKPLVVRAAGPSLDALGVPNTLDDPKIELFAGAAKTGENDNWGGSAELVAANAGVGAFAFTGPTSSDAAVFTNAITSDNSVKVSAVGTGTGAVIAEIYDATPAASFTTTTRRLINVSVLKEVAAGTTLTAGFVIGGSTSKQVLIRAVGPTLGTAPFNVPGVMADPRLDLFSGQTVINSNDNWDGGTALATAFTNVGAFALGSTSKDAALLVTLAPGNYTTQVSGGGASGLILVEVYEVPKTTPPGFTLIPAGTFTMGDDLDSHTSAALPTHVVTLPAYYLAQTKTAWSEWVAVREWAVTHGYTDLTAVGAGKADTHPVQTVSWYEVVKWLNAKSEKEGLWPVYYTNDPQTTVYRTGDVNVTIAQVNWPANGYRLPTEAEWEYAARGGLAGKRFPWGDTITHQQANYVSSDALAYDVSTTRGRHPTYATGAQPYTSPVGSFAANGYGVQDMAGNVWEWCWDWYGSYGSSAVTFPTGPSSGFNRVRRGGGWVNSAESAQSANRSFSFPASHDNYLGFRQARSSIP